MPYSPRVSFYYAFKVPKPSILQHYFRNCTSRFYLHRDSKFPEYRGQYILSKHLYRDIITNNGIYNSAKIQEYLGKHGNTRVTRSREASATTFRAPRFQGGARCIYISNYRDRCDGVIGKAGPGSLRQIALAFLFFRFTVSAASLIIQIGMKKPPFSEPR